MKHVSTGIAGLVVALALAVPAFGASGGAAKVAVHSSDLGKVIANAQGRTLYLFRADHGMQSACYGACASYWPPLLTSGRPKAGPGVKASLLGTIKRKDGKLQVTYKGHPLYLFVQDTRAGMTTGEGSDNFGAKWYALAPSGAVIDRD